MSLAFLTGCMGGGQNPDSLVEDFGIAYVKSPIPENGDDVRRPTSFNEGADLFYRDLAAPSASEHNVTFRVTGGMGDVRDVEASYDGERLLFAMREPEQENATEEPTWNIWEYEIETDQLRRIIISDITANAGDDLAPHYLPDGRIVFTSTRQRRSRARLLDEGKPQFAALDENQRDPALVLHVMNADGSEIRQISFNQSHDLDPVVLSSGEVMFSRWDNMGGQNQVSLYKMNPDGTELQVVYGTHSHATGTNGRTIQFVQAREREDGRVMSIVRPFHSAGLGGDIVLIDTNNYIDNDQPTAPNKGILSGPAQVPATTNAVRTDNGPSPGGRFSAAYPLWDGTDRALVSWSECRLLENGFIVPCTPDRLANPDVEEAPSLYGIFMYDMALNTQLPVLVPQEGVMFTDVVAAQPRERPEIIRDKVSGVDLDPQLVEEGVGILHIRSVYDFDGDFLGLGSSGDDIPMLADPAQTTADQRAARFLRVVKAVGIPGRDVLNLDGTVFGVSRGQLMREILGYAPIEPDGSVRIKVPADVPLAISILDKNGRRIGDRHQNWIQVRRGEEVTCNGCHNHNSGLPHSHAQQAPALNQGATSTGIPFPNTDPALFTDFGETMAQTLTRLDTATLNLRVDLVYEDVWTDEAAAGRAKDAGFDYRYGGLTTPAPVSPTCQAAWSTACRTVIHYPDHIHPLWTKDRGNDTCINCHTAVDAMGNPQKPAGQLELTDGPSLDQPDHLHAYRELVASDFEQDVIDGILQDVLVPIAPLNPDTGSPVLEFVKVPVTPPMSVGGANLRTFMGKFNPGGTHEGRLDPHELRLISEWLDIGGQYYNNPFDAPPP